MVCLCIFEYRSILHESNISATIIISVSEVFGCVVYIENLIVYAVSLWFSLQKGFLHIFTATNKVMMYLD